MSSSLDNLKKKKNWGWALGSENKTKKFKISLGCVVPNGGGKGEGGGDGGLVHLKIEIVPSAPRAHLLKLWEEYIVKCNRRLSIHVSLFFLC